MRRRRRDRCALAVYLAGLVAIHLLYRALRETTLVTSEEASGLVRGGNVGRVVQQPSSEQRFPGVRFLDGLPRRMAANDAFCGRRVTSCKCS